MSFLYESLKIFFLVIFLLTTGCRRADKESGQGPSASGVFKNDPVSVAVSLDKSEMTVAERLRFTISVDYPESYEIQFPAIEDKLDGLSVVDKHERGPALTSAGTVESGRDYFIEPFLPGEYEIPAVRVFFRLKDGDPVAASREIVTEPLEVLVRSVLPPATENLAIRDISGPFELPAGTFGAVAVLLIVLAALIIGLVLWRKRKHGKQAPVPVVPAWDLARMELRKLSEEKLVERGMAKEFFYRVSGILRRYIENRFGLRAPEQTTEEFLDELAGNEMLAPDYKTLLMEFLRRCDLVKFAEHQPDEEDVRLTFESCNRFIDATEKRPDGGENGNAV